MYAFIEGRVCEKTTNSLVLEAGGIGYQLNCSMTTLQEAPPMGEKMRCYTYLSVREDAMELFGFATKEEKQLFLSLTGISGVGAKTALGLLGAMPLRDLNLAILLGDVNQPTGKTATPTSGAAADNFAEAIEALTALGYSAIEAREALSHVEDKDAPVDELIRLALRAMAGM